MNIERGKGVSPGDDVGNPVKLGKQGLKRDLNLEHNARTTLGQQGCVTAGLDGVAKPLRGMKQDRLTGVVRFTVIPIPKTCSASTWSP